MSEEAALPNAQRFIEDYTEQYLILYYDLSKAQWQSNTHIEKEDTLNAYNTQQASEAFAAFVGSIDVIEKTQAMSPPAWAETRGSSNPG